MFDYVAIRVSDSVFMFSKRLSAEICLNKVSFKVSDSVLTFTKRLSAEICTPEGWSAMALKAAFMMGEG